MKKRIPALLWMLVGTAVLIAGLGAYLKYGVLRPLELYQDENIVAVPFLLLADEEAQYSLQAVQSEPEATETPATEPAPSETQPPVPTEKPTEPPVEETAAAEPVVIDESWFDDALFIGDSRTKGLSTYGRLGKADYFCAVGMTVYNVRSTKCSDKGFKKTNLENLLVKNTYGKVYINLGLNEIMRDRETLLKKYQDLIDLIQEKQPDAVIILQGIMTVNRKKAASKDHFSLESISSLNASIAAMAEGKDMRYIDVNEWIADEEGYLPDDLTKDGCHLYGTGYRDWSQWILENATTFDIE